MMHNNICIGPAQVSESIYPTMMMQCDTPCRGKRDFAAVGGDGGAGGEILISEASK